LSDLIAWLCVTALYRTNKRTRTFWNQIWMQLVMMSLEDYNAMQETTYLLRSPANARDLLNSIAELEAGNGTEKNIKTYQFAN